MYILLPIIAENGETPNAILYLNLYYRYCYMLMCLIAERITQFTLLYRVRSTESLCDHSLSVAHMHSSYSRYRGQNTLLYILNHRRWNQGSREACTATLFAWGNAPTNANGAIHLKRWFMHVRSQSEPGGGNTPTKFGR